MYPGYPGSDSDPSCPVSPIKPLSALSADLWDGERKNNDLITIDTDKLFKENKMKIERKERETKEKLLLCFSSVIFW